MTDNTDEDSKKGLLKWLLWLLLLLLIILGLFSYFNHAKNDSDDQASQQSSTPQPSSQTYTDLNKILSTSDASQLSGKSFDVVGAKTIKIIGDRSFTVGEKDKHVYALLNESLDNGTKEQKIQVKAGNAYHISGTLKPVPADTTSLVKTFQLSLAQLDELKMQGFYLAVSSIS